MALTGPEPVGARNEAERAGGWLGANPLRTVAIAMIVFSVFWRGQLAARGYLAADDYVLITQAFESDLTLAHLLTLYNNHFMPAGRLLIWLVTHAFGITYWPYVLLMTAGQALLGVAFYRLLRSLLRPGWLLLVPLAMLLFSPLTLEATSWWAVGVNMLPMQLAMVLALGAQLKYVRTGRKRHLVSLLLAVLLGLLFFEKALLVVPLVFLFTACLFVDGGPVRTVLTAVRRYWPSWLVLTAVSLGFLGSYLVRSESSLRRPESPGEVLSFLQQMLGSTLAPGLLGGPWRWLGAGDGAPVVAPPELARWVAWTVFAALILVTVRLHRRAGRAWILLGGYLVLVSALLATTRLGSVFSAVAGGVPRYVSDVVVVAALCVGVALLGLAQPGRVPLAAAEPRPNEPATPLPPAPSEPEAEREPDGPPVAVQPTPVPASAFRMGVIHAEAPSDPDPTPTAPAEPPQSDPTSGSTGADAGAATPPTGPDAPVPSGPTRSAPETADTPTPVAPGPGSQPTGAAPAGVDPEQGRPDLLAALPARYRELVSAGLALLLLAAGLGTAWTTSRYSDEWAGKYGRSYLDTVRIELASAPPGTVFFDQTVPPSVVPALSSPYNLQSRFFAAAGFRPVFVKEAETPSVLDASGHVHAAEITGSTIKPGPQEGCGYLVPAGQPVRMPLNEPRDDWYWVARVGYLSSTTGTATLRLGSGERTFTVKQGLNQWFFDIVGGGDAVELTLHAAEGALCTNEIAIGNPAPKQP
ncbi:hypothetical protein DKT68_02380 [Micromonospora acroterricola]|uniref:Uncharacterized protein n=1 Tax=Micromonospora acroterricola TaxID=2202421 RepID=A0A317DED8_9ACTN|nr:hypothetical protein [Micromonospora acroterricola]PWR12794.1 hypothetical protein DKT68_02380 [Micromonospora acroterricola]